MGGVADYRSRRSFEIATGVYAPAKKSSRGGRMPSNGEGLLRGKNYRLPRDIIKPTLLDEVYCSQ